jgi:hypothetical protein
VPVHQPPDHEGDKDQPEYAADPDRPTLTVIAAAVEPKPASKENHGAVVRLTAPPRLSGAPVAG